MTIRDSSWTGIAWWDGTRTTATPLGVDCVPSGSTSAPTGCPEPIWRSAASMAGCSSLTASRGTVSPSDRPGRRNGSGSRRGSRSFGCPGCPCGSAAESCGWKQPVSVRQSGMSRSSRSRSGRRSPRTTSGPRPARRRSSGRPLHGQACAEHAGCRLHRVDGRAAAPPSSASTVRINHADRCGHAMATPPSSASTVRINR